MVYSVPVLVNTDPITDALYSVRKMVYNEYGDSIPILMERNTGKMVRPTFRIEMGDSSASDISSAFYLRTRKYRIRYLGTSREDAENKASNIEYMLNVRKRLIPHMLKNWKYGEPALRAKDDGSLMAGTYYVRVAAKVITGEEYSLACDPVSITIEDNQDIIVMIPMVGGGIGYFTAFKIYFGPTSGSEKLLEEIDCNSHTPVTRYTITSLPSGNELVASQSEIHHRFIRVNNIGVAFLEDFTDIGKWDSIVSFDGSFVSARMKEQHVPIVTVNQQIVLEINNG